MTKLRVGRSRAFVTLLLAISCLATGEVVAQVPPSVARPNVLIIVTDDQRTDSFGVMPQTRELFEAQGVKYTKAFATTPLCCQSRASIMTGRYAHNHGVRFFTPYRLDQSTTLQAYLHEAGYRTGIFGKFLNAWHLRDNPPNFDEWAMFPESNAGAYQGGAWNLDGTITRVDEYATEFILQETSSFLDAAEADDLTPWYMYVAPPAPHEPFISESRYAQEPVPEWRGNPAVFERNLSDKPPYVANAVRDCDFQCGSALREAQLRTLMSVDDMVGGLFQKLDQLLESENTLAIFVSDNGFFWGEHHLDRKRPPYLPGVKIPLMVRWPTSLLSGVDDRIAANIDIAPTILQATEVPSREDVPIDGRSLLSPDERDRLLLEEWSEAGSTVPTWFGFVARRYQYIETRDLYRAPFHEYYDLVDDPYQLRNLMGDGRPKSGPRRARRIRLRQRLREARDCSGEECP